ncbi:hypothetical protein [Marinimicrobium locisalis]|uniref:hypothetical protein n=1 Tax=Marinimicrobium locisalis TaxID=546022 RepID=UPI003221A10D
MIRKYVPALISGLLIVVVIILFPHQFLFSKIVPNSLWTEYFPVPFGAGWFISLLVLFPSVWFSGGVRQALKGAVACIICAVIVAVPISVGLVGDALSVNNVINQVVWVSLILVPPCIVHISMFWVVKVKLTKI